MFDAQDVGDDELLSVPDVKVAAPTSKARPKPKLKRKGTSTVTAQPESNMVDASTAMDLDTGGEQANVGKTTAKGKRKVPQSKKGKGKATAKLNEIISDEENDRFITSELNSVTEASGRNKQAAAKGSQMRSPQSGLKCRLSLGSPQSPVKDHKCTRKGTVVEPDQRSSTTVNHTKSKLCPPLPEVEASDSSTNLMLALATAQLRVQDASSVPNTPNVAMADTAPADQVLTELNAPSGQNDPDQDEEMAMKALRDPKPVHPPSSPLTEPPSQGTEMREDEVHYSMPHRPVAGPSSHAAVAAAPRAAALPLMGGLHAGSLAKNRDGSGNTKAKAKPCSRRPAKAK